MLDMMVYNNLGTGNEVCVLHSNNTGLHNHYCIHWPDNQIYCCNQNGAVQTVRISLLYIQHGYIMRGLRG